MNKRLKTLKHRKTLFLLLSLLMTLGPVIGFVIYAIATGQVKNTQTTYGFGIFGIVAAFMALISAISKLHWRCPTFIIILGLYFVLDNLFIPIIILTVCTFLDEAVFHPLYKMYRDKYKIDKEVVICNGIA